MTTPGLRLIGTEVSTGSFSSSLSSVIALSLHLLFASYFLVIAVSIVTIACDNRNKLKKGFPQLHDEDRGWSPSLGRGWGKLAVAVVGLAADIDQQHV